MRENTETVRWARCPDCGRTVPTTKIQTDPKREKGPLTRVLWYALHLIDRAATKQDICPKSGRIASIVDGEGVAA